MGRLRLIILCVVMTSLTACGSMSFGETALHTVGAFTEASAIKQCYEQGGSRDLCEDTGW